MRKCDILNMENKGADKYEATVQGVRYQTYRSACAGRSKRRPEWRIVLPANVAEKLNVGDNIRVIKDAYHDLVDYAYLSNNGIVFAQKPRYDTKRSYKNYLLQIPGLLNGKIDRIAFCFALIQECHRRNLGVSLLAWRNLQKICQDNQNPGR